MKREISVVVGPELERIWNIIGLSESEKTDDVARLKRSVDDAYRTHLQQNYTMLETYRKDLRSAEDELLKMRRAFGEPGNSLSNMSKPIRDQIPDVKLRTIALHEKYRYRVDEFDSVVRELRELFDILGIDESERAGFDEVGQDDLTEERLERLKERRDILDTEFAKRQAIVDSLNTEISDLASELGEQMPEFSENCRNDDVNASNSVVEQLQALKHDRAEEIEGLCYEIERLYTLLAVDTEDRIMLPREPKESSIRTLVSERDFLIGQKKTRLPDVLNELANTISRLCDFMNIPHRQRPRYTGSDYEEGVSFLQVELENLRQQQIDDGPMINLIYELERLREAASPSVSGVVSRERGSSQRLWHAERARKKAMDALPKLESRLARELTNYRRERGRDFMFGDVAYISTISTKAVEEASDRAVSRRLLLSKMKESLSPRSKVPK